MSLFCANHATQLPHNLVVRRKNLTSKHVGVLLLSSSKCCLVASSNKVGLPENAASLSGFHRTSPSIMEDEKLGIISSETEEYSTELDVAVRIVQMACFLCQRVQERLISKGNNQVKSKDDNSPVTVAVQIEKEIQSSPKKFFHRFMDLPSHFHKAVGHDSHRSTLLEGDGKNVGSLLHFNYALDGTTVLSTVVKIEALDEEKYLVIFGGHEGDPLKRYKVIKFIYQVIPKHPKSSVICSIEYEKLNESVPDPTDYVNYGGKIIEGIDGIALQD